METKEFKGMEWLRKIRDEHYEETKNKTWEEDHQEISHAAADMVKSIEEIRTAKTQRN
ncbi:MAG: hypothetical protein AB1656_26000 [Candidatus Omnitrophota bacterium]